jgi:hypothetical protein
MKPLKSSSSRSKVAVSKQVKAANGGFKTANEQEQAAKEQVELQNSKRFGDLLSTEIWILIFELV